MAPAHPRPPRLGGPGRSPPPAPAAAAAAAAAATTPEPREWLIRGCALDRAGFMVVGDAIRAGQRLRFMVRVLLLLVDEMKSLLWCCWPLHHYHCCLIIMSS